MNEPPELCEEVRRWVEKAEHDLQNAEYVLGLKEECPTDTVCFHCQQCAEKYLEALLIFNTIEFPRTHDLVLLFNLAERVVGHNLEIEQVQPLNRYSVEARYPGDWDPISFTEATDALRMAKSVRTAVRGAFPKEVLPN